MKRQCNFTQTARRMKIGQEQSSGKTISNNFVGNNFLQCTSS